MQNLKNKDRITLINNQDIFDIIQKRVSAGNNGATVFVPHVCNNIDLFAAGFAAQVAEQFPIVAQDYHMLGKTFLKNNMGHCQIVKVYEDPKFKHKLYFANMIAQNGTRSARNSRPLNYFGLTKSMFHMSQYIKVKTGYSSNTEKIEIHAPKFGSGLAGGNWNFINDLIQDIWGEYLVYVYNNPKR